MARMNMSDLRPIEQVKENHSGFTLRVRTPEEKHLYKLEKYALNFGVSLETVQRWDATPGGLPRSFTCRSCKHWETNSPYNLKRCSICSKQRSSYRRAKKWKRLILQEWLKKKKQHPVKYKTMKFITLTIENFKGEGLDHKEVNARY